MFLIIHIFLIIVALSLTTSHTHEEIAKCSLTGVHKSRQTIIESPNYPSNYTPDRCWDYVIRSPYKCTTTFHIQFLDFYLEFSKDCQNDYLAIGLENVDDDMDVLCGQVVGIKKYHTPDGILRLRFFADQKPWTTGKGFKLLVTRLACEREHLLKKEKGLDYDDNGTVESDNADDTIAVSAPSEHFQPPETELMQIFRNLTGKEQYQIFSLPPVFGLKYPTQLPAPPYPSTGTVYIPSSESLGPLFNYPTSNLQNNVPPPCTKDNGQQSLSPDIFNYYGALSGTQLAAYPNTLGVNIQANYPTKNVNQLQHQQAAVPGPGFFTNPRDQFIGSWSSAHGLRRAHDNTLDSLEDCCVSGFKQKHFYLSSPGFPRTIFSNILPNTQKRDCVFRLQKSTNNVCRLRLDFKFFDFGQSYQGTGSYMGNIGLPAIESTRDVCQEDFIEVDNQRFCGCRSGYTFTAYWTTAADKKLRMRMGYSGVPSGGFLLELIQEECSEAELTLITTERPGVATLSTIPPNPVNDQVTYPQQTPQTLLGQQQQSLQGDPYRYQQQQQQNSNTGFYGNPLQQANYLEQQQQLFQTPGNISINLQQQNPFLPQQIQHLHTLQNNNLHPSQFGSNYFSYHPLQNFQQNPLQQQGLATNSYGLPQLRYARSYVDQQPVTVVETNSTRKEYYFSDNDPLNLKQESSYKSISDSAERPSKWDRKDNNAHENHDSISNVARPRRKCSFDMADILRLSVDILWVTKPICYAPQRNWFTNWIG